MEKTQVVLNNQSINPFGCHVAAFSQFESNPGVFFSSVWFICTGEKISITLKWGPKQLIWVAWAKCSWSCSKRILQVRLWIDTNTGSESNMLCIIVSRKNFSTGYELLNWAKGQSCGATEIWSDGHKKKNPEYKCDAQNVLK